MNLHAQNIADLRWKNRVLIVHTNGDSAVKFTQQLREFEGADSELKERKLVLYAIKKDQLSFTSYPDGKSNYEAEIPPDFLGNYRNPKEDFEVHLIGLDGVIKLREKNIVTLEKLFAIIDAMPMRRNEIKN
ncbi:DUF4174 domain-containing protein [Robiginitalea myxolifaciens]|nr:DUF4174 domain-containing protein [Robiginitalea myxolifaciens]